jgi:hypothetical protein
VLARTDRDGKVSLRLDSKREGGSDFCVLAPGFALEPFHVAHREDAPSDVTVTLRPGHSVSGTVVYPDGVAVSKASVFVSRKPGSNMEWFRMSSALTGSDGTFEIANLSEGPYELTAHVTLQDQDPATTETSATLSDVQPGPGVRIVLPRIEIKPLRAELVLGCVEKATGKPVLKCTPMLTRPQSFWVGLAIAPGEFAFRLVPAGEWKLQVTAAGFAPEERMLVLAEGKVTRVTIALEKGVTLRGRLRPPEGKPFNRPEGALLGARHVPTIAPDGSFEIIGLAPGSTIGFIVWDHLKSDLWVSYSTAKKDFVKIAEDRDVMTVDIPLVLSGGLAIYIDSSRMFAAPGRATDAQRDLSARARLQIRNSEGEVVADETGLDTNWGGHFPVGEYSIRLEVPGFPVQEQTVQVTAGQTVTRFKVE